MRTTGHRRSAKQHSEGADQVSEPVQAGLSGRDYTVVPVLSQQGLGPLYRELRGLMGRVVEEPELQGEIDRRLAQLRMLQEAEADLMEQRFQARSVFNPHEARLALAQARKLLAEDENPAAEHPALSEQD